MPNLNRVVIVGGGVGGLTSALALKNAGVDVEVHEKYDHLAGRATGFTLWSYAIKILLGLGLDDPKRIGQPIEFTEIHNQKGKLIEEMPVGEVSRKLGAPSCDVRRRDMQKVLIELLGDGIVKMGSEVRGRRAGGRSGHRGPGRRRALHRRPGDRLRRRPLGRPGLRRPPQQARLFRLQPLGWRARGLRARAAEAQPPRRDLGPWLQGRRGRRRRRADPVVRGHEGRRRATATSRWTRP